VWLATLSITASRKMMLTRVRDHMFTVALLACSALFGCTNQDDAIQPLTLDFTGLHGQLDVLGRALGDSRVVLLGENGHGVGEFTRAKVQLIEWLHDEHGFDIVAIESGFFECGHVWNRIEELAPVDALLQCLRYPLQHAEILPLFELIRADSDSEHPLALAGIDIQAQGFDSEDRPAVLHDILTPIDPDLASRIAAVDAALFLLSSAGGQGDDVYAWVLENGETAREAYEAAAAVTQGWEQWVFRLATGWIDRLAVRARAEAEGIEDRPARYYEIRDEWMAQAVAALADSMGGEHKIVVYLHNDHARYGNFESGAHSVRSTGSFLRERYGDEVFSVGFFMGSGVIADNGRNEREVATPAPLGVESFLGSTPAPASYLVLRGNTEVAIREWASSARSYLRMGLTPMSLVPGDEFDALFYIDSVGPPNYELR
jgi:erythromycin esterase